MFFGYKKIEKYYIAEPEKAILDMIITGQNPETHQIDWEKLDPKKLLDYAKTKKRLLQRLYYHPSIAKIITKTPP